jgi:hypothetical protein
MVAHVWIQEPNMDLPTPDRWHFTHETLEYCDYRPIMRRFVDMAPIVVSERRDLDELLAQPRVP